MKKPKKYKAKAKNSKHYYEGYYFEMPETTYCFDIDPKPKILHFLVCHEMTDWGLPNKAVLVEIDMDTLEEIDG